MAVMRPGKLEAALVRCPERCPGRNSTRVNVRMMLAIRCGSVGSTGTKRMFDEEEEVDIDGGRKGSSWSGRGWTGRVWYGLVEHVAMVALGRADDEEGLMRCVQKLIMIVGKQVPVSRSKDG